MFLICLFKVKNQSSQYHTYMIEIFTNNTHVESIMLCAFQLGLILCMQQCHKYVYPSTALG